MRTSITGAISDQALAALDQASRSEGVSASEIVDRALRSYLLARGF
jgi:metal-responsive CopG/Arc/MetJ family transcriptional regulator